MPAILADMDADGGPDAGNLDRLRDLCADLAGAVGDGQLLAWADASVPAAVPDVVFGAVSDAADRSRRARRLRRYQDEPRDIFAEVASLTGPGTRWWTNTDLSTWNPVTQHTFDAMVVGAGNGIVVTLIAFEGG